MIFDDNSDVLSQGLIPNMVPYLQHGWHELAEHKMNAYTYTPEDLPVLSKASLMYLNYFYFTFEGIAVPSVYSCSTVCICW